MRTQVIKIAELGVVKCPDRITTLGLGSCIGVVLYDKVNKIGGMVHVMLPECKGSAENKAKFADTGVDLLLNEMLKRGVNRKALVAKIAGGAHMFGGLNSKSDILKVGDRNAANSIAALSRLRIPLVAKDVGGQYGRTIELNTEDGMLRVKTVGRGEKLI